MHRTGLLPILCIISSLHYGSFFSSFRRPKQLYNASLYRWLNTFSHSEDIRFNVYICAILDYAADLRGDGPAKIGTLTHFTLEYIILIYFAVPFVLDLCKINYQADCIRV